MAEPQWKRIASDLAQRIREGEFPPGSYLPHRDQLREEYGRAGTNTIATATRALTEQLLVRRVANKGLLVLDPTPAVVDLPFNVPDDSDAWRRCCERVGLAGNLIVTGLERGPASADVAELLDLRTGDEVVTRPRRATIDGITVRLDWAIYPGHQVDGAAVPPLTISAGGFARVTVWSRPSTSEESAMLKLPGGTLVLAADRVVLDVNARAVELVRVVANPRRVRLHVEDTPLRHAT